MSSHTVLSNQAQVRSRQSWLLNLALTLPFLGLFWLNLAHHQLWSDELISWGIARASNNFARIFYFTHFEAHPWLWYAILWLPARLTANPQALKWVEVIIGSSIYLILGMLSPFTRLQKVLFFLSYYVVFEYTILSRLYSVMLLLALLYVMRRVRKPDGYIGNLALLGLMASTDAVGFILSCALLCEYAFDRWMAHRTSGWLSGQRRRIVWAALLYASLVGLSIWSLRPIPGTSWEVAGKLGGEMFQGKRILGSISNLIAGPWWPLSSNFPHRFWITYLGLQRRLLLLTPLILFAYWRIFRRERNLLLLMALTLGAGILFADVVYAGRARHWGISFLAFLIALWMQHAKRERTGEPRPQKWDLWAYALMCLAAISGVFATASSWTHPFSQAGNTAAWIRSHEPANVAIVDDWDFNLTAVAQQLGRPVYFLECACVDNFKLFAHSRDRFDRVELPARLNLAMKNLNSPTLLLVNSDPLTPADMIALRQASLVAKAIITFDGAEVAWQNYYLYSIMRQQP